MANEIDDDIKDDLIEELAEGGVVDTEHDDAEEATAKVDSEIDNAVDEIEREEIRERRRKERKSRSQKSREKIETLERNLNALMAQNATLQQQVGTIQNANTGAQLAQVDQAIEQAHNAAEHYKKIIAQATVQQNGQAVAEATEYMLASRQRANELTAFKQQATRAINAPKPLNPQLVSKSQSFLGKNSWYGGPTSTDPDSKVLTALDNSLAAEGWDATTDSYWEELETRAKKYLPHRIKSDAPSSTRRVSNPVTGGNQASSTGDKGGTFTLSSDRVAAIKSAGMWDDTASRNAMIKSYRNFDKSNGRG